MQALKIRLHGRYWDSYLYNDSLLLITDTGEIETYSWDQVVAQIAESVQESEPAFTHLAARGQAWYSPPVQDLLKNSAMRSALDEQLKSVTSERFHVNQKTLAGLRNGIAPVANFPTTDLECYLKTLYVGSTEGLMSVPVSDIAYDGVPQNSQIYDGPSLRVAASYGRLAIAQGPDGLVEADSAPSMDWNDPAPARLKPRLVSREQCDSCNWIRFDVVATQVGGGGYVGAFTRPPPRDKVRYPAYERDLLGTIPSHDLFAQEAGTLVGGLGLLALIQDDEITSEAWMPQRRREGHGVDLLRSRGLGATTQFSRGDEIIDAALAVFGVVTEFDSRLAISATDGTRLSIPGEPVRWRVFPRSVRYINHLHVVKDDWIDIYAFAHDYFVDPDERGVALAQPTASASAVPDW